MQNSGDVIMKMFRAQNYRPYRLPIYKVIEGPADTQRLDEFMEAYRKEENWEEAIQPYAGNDLQTVLLFCDEASGQLLYTTFNEFTDINRVHINLGEMKIVYMKTIAVN